MMGNFGNLGNFGFGFGWIIMILFWALIIWAIVALVRSFSRPRYDDRNDHSRDYHRRDEYVPRESSAMNVLKERYAKGEINEEEYLRMKKELE